jgi:hypothetical protein
LCGRHHAEEQEVVATRRAKPSVGLVGAMLAEVARTRVRHGRALGCLGRPDPRVEANNPVQSRPL